MRTRIALVFVAAALVAGCTSATHTWTRTAAPPTPAAVLAVASPAPTASPMAVATPKATPVPTAAPKVAQLVMVPCKTAGSGDCSTEGYRMADTISLGGTAAFTFTVKNAGSKMSGPVTALVMGAEGLSWFPPDEFTISCDLGCRVTMMNQATGWYIEWPASLKPGDSMRPTIWLTSHSHDYQYHLAVPFMVALYAAPLSLGDTKPDTFFAANFAEWDRAYLFVQ